ncbi:MAG: hypothetical protein V4585_18115 [Bacteroidota bacterium]
MENIQINPSENNYCDDQSNNSASPESDTGEIMIPESEMMSDDAEEGVSPDQVTDEDLSRDKNKNHPAEVDLPDDIPDDETPANSDLPKKAEEEKSESDSKIAYK